LKPSLILVKKQTPITEQKWRSLIYVHCRKIYNLFVCALERGKKASFWQVFLVCFTASENIFYFYQQCRKSDSESSGPCIETIINPCNMVLVSLFVSQCCLDSGHTTESPFTFNTLDKRTEKKICVLHVSTEIANIHAHKVISDAFLKFSNSMK
jgi:hypothetical protein